MANKPPLHSQRHVIPADRSAQKPNNSFGPVMEYETKRVPCSGCGKPVVWTAEQQRTWYEEMKASIYATVNLRCDSCRKRGQHDNHRQGQREKARQRSGGSSG